MDEPPAVTVRGRLGPSRRVEKTLWAPQVVYTGVLPARRRKKMQKRKALITHMSLCGGFLRSACKCVGTRLPPKKDLCCAFDHPTGLPSCRSTPSVGRHLAKNSAVTHLSKSNVRQHVSSSTYCCSQLRTVWLMVSKPPRLGEGVPDFLRRHFQLQRNAPKNKQEP